MTVSHLKEVFSLYHNKWSKHYPAERQDTSNLDPRNKEKVLSHAMWMCEQGIEFANKDTQKDIEKAMRWLGFVQAVFFYTGHYTIDEMRAHSASPDEP
jgi:hypothetical protein